METDNLEETPMDEGLGTIIFSILRGTIDTITVGIVQGYDPSKQLVTVQPAIMRLKENEAEYKPRALLGDVRVVFPGSGDYWSTFPISKGDPVLLLSPSRSLDEWFDSGEVVAPGSTRIFDLNDSIAIPGILDDGNIIPNLKNDGFYIRTKDETKFIKLSDSGIDVLGDLDVDGAITATGDITANASTPLTAVSLATHTHTTPSGPSGPPIVPAP